MAGLKYASANSLFIYYSKIYSNYIEQFKGVLNSWENELINIDWNPNYILCDTISFLNIYFIFLISDILSYYHVSSWDFEYLEFIHFVITSVLVFQLLGIEGGCQSIHFMSIDDCRNIWDVALVFLLAPSSSGLAEGLQSFDLEITWMIVNWFKHITNNFIFLETTLIGILLQACSNLLYFFDLLLKYHK